MWLVGVWKGLNLGSIRNFSLCFGMYPKIIDVNPKLIPKRGVVQFCHLYVKIRSAMHKLWTKKRFCNISLASFSYSVSPGTVSNRPNLYSVTFWGSYEEVQLYRKWIKIEVLQMIFYIFKSILISKNLAACFNLVSSPSYEDFLKGASIKVTLYGFRTIQGFRAKNFFRGQINYTEVVSY